MCSKQHDTHGTVFLFRPQVVTHGHVHDECHLIHGHVHDEGDLLDDHAHDEGDLLHVDDDVDLLHVHVHDEGDLLHVHVVSHRTADHAQDLAHVDGAGVEVDRLLHGALHHCVGVIIGPLPRLSRTQD